VILGAGGVALVVEHLPSKPAYILSLNHSTSEKKQRSDNYLGTVAHIYNPSYL
jgi:hypothetical protein